MDAVPLSLADVEAELLTAEAYLKDRLASSTTRLPDFSSNINPREVSVCASTFQINSLLTCLLCCRKRGEKKFLLRYHPIIKDQLDL